MDLRQFEADHRAILEAIDGIEARLGQPDGTEALIIDLRAVRARIELHLVVEDRFLYPELCAARDPELRQRAQSFQIEVGDLREQFIHFADQHLHGQPEPLALAEATAALLQALRRRIERENSELYPLAAAL